jgi:Zn finger protein HypA/HybF involved in hydrogenase expression
MKSIEKECLYCKEKFQASLKEVNRGNGKFCSRSCASKLRAALRKPKPPNVKCANCGKDFYKNESNKRGSRHSIYFCCRKCKDDAQRIGGIKEIQPPHYGTATSNYRDIAFNNKESKCESCGYDKIVEVLQVHHLDRDRNNNSQDNLQILCPTCHMEIHFLTKTGLWKNSGDIS